MTIYSIGCDLVHIARISQLFQEYGSKFTSRILTADENAQLSHISHASVKAAFIAKRFAAKEAYAKAWGCGIGENLSFLDIELSNDSEGKPYFTNKSKKLRDDTAVHLSLADDGGLALAYVVIEIVQAK